MTYLITYDLIRPSTSVDYDQLYDAIRSFKYWAKPLESVWLIKTEMSREEIMNILRSKIDVNDKLLIMEISNRWIAYNIPDAVVNWMRQTI